MLPEVCSVHARIFPAFFFLTIVIQNVVPWLPDVTECHVTLKGFPWVCACATGSWAISALVGPFDSRSDRRSPEGGGRGVRMRNRKLRNIRPSGAFSLILLSDVLLI